MAMNYISSHLDSDLTLDEIARSASFSPFHFHRIFRIVVGETIAEFTRRLRLESAASRLCSNPRHGITQIAMDYGFSSPQNFAKAFRQHFGMTPSAYRQSKMGNKQSKDENGLTLHMRFTPADEMFTKPQPRRMTVKAEVKNMPEYNVAYVRKMGPYGKETCEQAFGELMSWAGPRGYLSSGAVLGLYWDSPEVTPPAKCRTDACVSVPQGTAPEGQVGIQTINGGPHAVCHFEIAEDGFKQAWEEAFTWFIHNGYECDDKPCYELYHNNAEEHPQRKWIVDICIPLKQV